MTLLIATDEAGYGPKLGPLVIVATAWRLPRDDSFDLSAFEHGSLRLAFENLSVPIADPRCGVVYVDDSKRVYKRRPVTGMGQESMLDVVCRAASQWASLPDPALSFWDWLETVAKSDFHIAIKAPWFADWRALPKTKPSFSETASNSALISHWASNGLELCGVTARLITAAAFNKRLESGDNKADILTDATCRMAIEMIEATDQTELDVVISSDRHGGRAYYGSAIQHSCDGAMLRVVSEDKTTSRYHLSCDSSLQKTRRIDWSFCVGGDSFPPVAMSSMIAKWLRERAMFSFNKYFADRAPPGFKLRPTAGYPGDADRFIDDIKIAGLRDSLPDSILIRQR